MDDYEEYAGKIRCIDLREKSLEQALFEIQKRPYLWLAENNLACLRSFITGWLNAQINYPDEEHMMEFTNYVLCYFDDQKSALGWYGMISQKYADKTEEEKWNVFYDLLTQYSKAQELK